MGGGKLLQVFKPKWLAAIKPRIKVCDDRDYLQHQWCNSSGHWCIDSIITTSMPTHRSMIVYQYTCIYG